MLKANVGSDTSFVNDLSVSRYCKYESKYVPANYDERSMTDRSGKPNDY